MMTKSTNKLKRWGFTFLLIPLFAVLLYSFSAREEILEKQTYINSENTESTTENSLGKWLRIRINGKKIVINGKATTLEKFASSIDKLTENWTATEKKNFKSDIQIQNAPIDFLKKLNVEYKKTNLYKTNPTNHDLIPPPPPLPPSRVGEVIEVPMPPSAKKPLDHIIDMAKKGATFYLEGKKASSDAAIKYAEKHKHFQIKINETSAAQPSVHISKSKNKKEIIEIIKEEGENKGLSQIK